ncbi:nineteen complex-related protein 2-domain-containing protein [Roridomyces roridus]|uniref:Nineteen complex-related protein 2-domain-containing protein n=1 Tax=Roridomyces roridus TaxID=1738132 RepID=A0AAD7CAR5_9AGAR|nr:nineteen complex-related protein 2-domain-containing protein [Roridomyces roridus]
MSDSSPLIFKRRSKPAARTRPSSPEPESNDMANESPSTLVTKIKKRAKPKSRLSFGTEEEEEGGTEVFKVKKSNLSQRLSLGTHPSNVLPNLDQASISPHRGPTYDKAYLNELKASTPSSRAPANDPYDADMSMDVGDMSIDVSMQVDVFESSTTSIPSESSIKVAKERRERLRATGVSGQDDFISLSVVKRADEPQGPHPDSRLVREEDELGEGDDEFAEYTSAQERIALGKKSRKVEASKRRDAMKEMIADAEEIDEETEEWEQEQIRRGAQAPIEKSPAIKAKETYKPTPIPPATTLPSLGPALSRLTHQLTQLTTSHASNTTALTNIAKESAEVDDREQEMRQMVERAEAKRAWFGQFREWYPLLEKLEEEHASLIQERFDMIKARRIAEDEDDLYTMMGVTRPPDEEETDELGRAIPKPTPSSRRAARLERHQRHQSAEEEGYSTDSSLPPSDLTSYRGAIALLTERAGQVLSDVRAEEFRDPGKGRWSAWREQYSDSYVGAWGGLGVVSVWEFWVRLEIVGWDIIREPQTLDGFKWYEGLYSYSRPNGEDLGPDGDLVASMISTAVIPRMSLLIERGAFDAYSANDVRRMVDVAEEVESSVEDGSAKFLMLLKAILVVFRAEISECERIVQKVKGVSDPGSARAFDPAAIPARSRFLNRRIKLLRNLLRWKKYTGGRLGIDETISRLAASITDLARGGWDGGQSYLDQVQALIRPPG